MSSSTIVDPLNPEQREAVTRIEGPLLILAGPGSGKTVVITRKIAHLLDRGISHREILGVTFTNKAAREMRSRVEELLGSGRPLPWIHTFHAACARILRSEISKLAPHYNGRFTIFDETDQREAIRRAMKESDVATDEVSPAMCSAVIERAKDELVGPEEFRERYAGRFDSFIVAVVDRVYRRYQGILTASNALDFADLLRLTVRILHENLEVLHAYRQRFRYVLVDEYQDINHAQYVFARTLAEGSRNISVVGDEDQAIFSWRGSDPTYILRFTRDFPDAKVVELKRHYRWPGGDRIFRAARHLIAHNRDRVKKGDPPAGSNGRGIPIHLIVARDEQEEAWSIAQQIARLRGEGLDPSRMAVLYRVNTLSRALEEALIRMRIPYEIIRGLRFYERREVKDLMAYLRALVNPNDEVSLLRALARPRRGIGEATVSSLREVAAQERISLWEGMVRLAEEPDGHLRGQQARAVKGFVEAMAALRERAEHAPPSEVALEALDRSGYLSQLHGSPEGEERMDNLRELIGQMREYEARSAGAGLSGFLEEVALLSEADHLSGEEERVGLMTLHAAKGLEFDCVFIAGVEENLLPHARALDEGMLEEERRLFYVGMTRARDRLCLSMAHERSLYGNAMLNGPSRFLSELPADDLEVADGQGLGGGP